MKLTAILSLVAGSAFSQGRPPAGGAQGGGAQQMRPQGDGQRSPQGGQQVNGIEIHHGAIEAHHAAHRGRQGEQQGKTQNPPRGSKQANASGQSNNNRMERQENRQEQREENRDEKRAERKENRQELKNERMQRRSGSSKVEDTNTTQPSTNNAY